MTYAALCDRKETAFVGSPPIERAMPICQLCSSIPFTNIPAQTPGPRGITDFGKLQSNPPLNFWRVDLSDKEFCENGNSFHRKIADLRASAGRCELCRIIHHEVSESLRVYNECCQTEWYSNRFDRPHALDDGLGIVERIDKGSGFAVVACMKDRQPPTCVVLANVSTFVARGKDCESYSIEVI